jgi:pyruvate carboxylase
MMKGHERENSMNLEKLNQLSNYWEDVREYYFPFESELKAGTAEVFDHEIPGGQYSNLRPQARSLGLEEKFSLVKKNYAVVNRMFGDIVKVTPSSKVVGDMALFMTSNGYTAKDIMENGESISFPDSVIGLFKGDLGQIAGGFPPELQKIILKNEAAYTERPNAYLEPIDFEAAYKNFTAEYGNAYTFLDLLSYLFYPKVFAEYHEFQTKFGNLHYLPTPVFFFGLKANEETLIELARGKSILIKMLYSSAPDENGIIHVFFKLNGQTRNIEVRDKSFTSIKPSNKKVSTDFEIGAPLQGKLSRILVKSGDVIELNTPLFTIEAMKMESTIISHLSGTIRSIVLKEGVLVSQDDVIVELIG